jgi:hypothetical protein
VSVLSQGKSALSSTDSCPTEIAPVNNHPANGVTSGHVHLLGRRPSPLPPCAHRQFSPWNALPYPPGGPPTPAPPDRSRLSSRPVCPTASCMSLPNCPIGPPSPI